MRILYVLVFFPFWLGAQPKEGAGISNPHQSASSSQVTVVSDTTKFASVGERMGILEDKTGRLTFEQVQRRHDFVPSRSENFQYGFSSSAYWFRFTIRNQSQENTKHWLLGLLDAATLDYVDLYLVYPNGQVKHQMGGLKRPYVDQGFFATTPFFRVTLPKNAPVTVYFRIKSSLTMYGKVTVWEEYYNLSKGRVIIFAIWMFLGLFILRSLNNFVLARFIPDPQFRFYAVCTFLLYLSTLSRTGVYPIIFSGHPHLLEWMHYGMGRMLPVGMGAWMYNLLDNRPAFRPLRWLLLGVMGVCILGVFLPFLIQRADVGLFFASISTLMYGLFFLNVILIWFTPHRTRFHFVLPITLCTIPFFVYQLQTLSLISYRPIISQLALVALAIEMVSMSLVLGRIVQSYIKDRITTADALIREKVEVDKLQELDAVKTQFFANISHEFRTPLTLILGPLTDLKQRFPAEPILTLVERNGQRLLSLINQLLDLSKLEAGQLRAEPKQDDMAAFFRTLTSSFRSLADSRQIRFTVNQNMQACPASFDVDKLEKITTNLLANAFKFTPSGNEVRMSVHYEPSGQPERVKLTVADTGIGIAPEHAAHIFERFYQVDGRANRSYEGTGIGLALVHELVKVLGGTIDVASTEGVGTTFVVTLPLVTVDTLAPRTMAPPIPVELPGWSALSPGREVEPTGAEPSLATDNVLLIIDDNADIRTYARSIFGGEYQILEAVDGQEGFEKATASLPNLVICDLMMPRLDGFGFCKALKSQEATSHIPVIMLTAKATVEDRIEGFMLGADDYLTKPFHRAELQARVRNLILQRQRLYQRFTTATPELVENINVSTLVEPLELPQPGLLKTEQAFLDRLKAVVLQHLDQTDFTVEILAEAVNMSRVQLHRKLKALTNLTTTEFIRHTRLTVATELLRKGDQNVTQVALAVGFDNLSYFAKVFQEQHGVTPSQYSRVTPDRVTPDRVTPDRVTPDRVTPDPSANDKASMISVEK
ncbi:7TM-DISM domain-containing protein [Spirosoma soli]|uniref:histidine kinase n=1 Tax=Spirosoma soli TaxID=1770529 RepID=A0ABW5M6L7_9BACT